MGGGETRDKNARIDKHRQRGGEDPFQRPLPANFRKVFMNQAWRCLLLVLILCPDLNPSLDPALKTSDPGLGQFLQKGKSLDLKGQVGGPTNAVAVQGQYACVGVGVRMVVLDISKPARNIQLGATKPMDGFVTGVVISEKAAYVTVGGAGLYSVNIANPRNPSIMGFFDSPGYPENACVNGNIVYLADGWAGMQVVDISDPKSPKEVGSISTIGYAFDIAADGTVVYIAAAGAGLKVVDVKDPTKPVEIGGRDTPGYAYGLGLSQDRKTVYVADGWEGLKIIDVSDPYHPRPIGSCKTRGWAFDVVAKSDILYVADAFKGLRILDVSSPSSPKEIGAYEIEGLTHAGRLFLEKNSIYLADKNSGLHIIDVSNTSKPTRLNFIDFMDVATGVTTIGQYLCAAAGRNGLQVIDMSKPANLREVGSFQSQRHAFCIATDGRYAYLGAHEGLHILDISNPFQPKQIGFFQEPGGFIDMVIKGKAAYIANEFGLLAVDISDPFDPKKLGFISLIEWPLSNAWGLDVSGTVACVVGGLSGLQIIDVSNPKNPRLIGRFKHIGYVNDVAMAQAFAFTVGGDGLTAFDISNPRQPKKLGVLDLPGIGEEISVESKIAYVSAGGGGLIMVDVSNPRTPTWAGSYNTPGYAENVHLKDGFIYVADQDGGVQILEKSPGRDIHSGPIRPNSKMRSYDRYAGLSHEGPFKPFKTSRMAGLQKIPQYSSQTNTSKPRDDHAGEALQKGDDSCPYPNALVSSRKFMVTNPNDSGQGSLRWCLENARRGDAISFDSSVFPPGRPITIVLSSQLPDLDQGRMTIDASDAGVIISGKKLPGKGHGIRIISPGNTIRGMQIFDFPYHGISIEGDKSVRNVIGGDRTRGKGPVGQGNVLSGNGANGITISGGANNNIVIGNLIGTDASGKIPKGNKTCGVWIHGRNNRIGGLKPGERNVISGNGLNGVLLNTDNTSGNTVVGNYIGTDMSGARMLSNTIFGISIELGAYDNTIKNNVIAADGQPAISINDSGSSYNVMVGNFIGTDATGKAVLGRGSSVCIGMGTEFNRIGGSHPNDKNIINVEGGIQFFRQAGAGHLVLGNCVGTDPTGAKSASRLLEGVRLGSGCRRPFIGGTTEGERNIFGDFEWAGITVDRTADDAWIAGNDFRGSEASGVCIFDMTEQNVVQENIFRQNDGIQLEGTRNVVVGNTIRQTRKGVFASGDRNLIYLNKFVENKYQATDSGNNEWDRNEIGNYWSDYQGSDSNRDGIGDTPYQIFPNGVDHYPLMNASHTLTVQVNPPGSGNVTIFPDKSGYSYGENTRLTANPSRGYAFSAWSGDCPSSKEKDNPLTLTMNTNKIITANFISSAASFLSVSKKLLNFGAVEKGATIPDQTFQILTGGGEESDWRITDNAVWLACSPQTGAGSALVNVSADPSGLSVGTYTATISVYSSQSNAFQNIAVVFQVIPPSEAGAPFGEWDRPQESSYPYRGCFHFSGWALDKIGIESVEIFGIESSGDDPARPSEAYVGEAFFVEGARPDIEAGYFHVPQCSRAAWGYNFIPEMLPRDGFYTFVVRARSVTGATVELGRKKLRIENRLSLYPSGTLDSPPPGELISGSSYDGSGWALGKGRSHISEVHLFIDSQYEKSARLGFPRPEMRFVLPPVSGLDLGFRATFETTSLSDAYHTAFVVAWDNKGRRSILGSRYFYSKRPAIPGSRGIVGRKIYGEVTKRKARKEIEYIKKRVEIRVNELKSVAIKGFSEKAEGTRYKAFYKGQGILPLGMSLDEQKGIISWLPIPAFRGEFSISLAKIKNSSALDKKEIVFYIK